MTKVKSTAVETVVKSVMNIVNRAIAAWEGSDKDNLEKFYKGIIKNSEREITAKETFISVEKARYEAEIEQLEEALEDAVNDVEESKVSISSNLLKTNAQRAEQISRFWTNVNNTRRIVKRIESDILEKKEDFEKLKDITLLEIEQLKSDIEDLKK